MCQKQTFKVKSQEELKAFTEELIKKLKNFTWSQDTQGKYDDLINIIQQSSEIVHSNHKHKGKQKQNKLSDKTINLIKKRENLKKIKNKSNIQKIKYTEIKSS